VYLEPEVLAFRVLARRVLAALALGALVSGGAACDEPAPAPQEGEERVIVKLAFDEVLYVDAAITTRKLIERIRRQNESIFGTLRRANVTITAKRVVDVDLAHLDQEPVTVVDLDSGITRAAQRVRYRFLALALAPRALANKGEAQLGALHIQAPLRPEVVLGACTANGDRERAAVGELWTVFDASLPACGAAIAREQAAIDVARKRLTSPAKEIVSAEFERLYVPIKVELFIREQPQVAAASGAGGSIRYVSWADKLREQSSADAEEERELARLSRPANAGASRGDSVITWGSAVYTAPNFTLLYVAVAALILLLVGWRRQDRDRRG
jgi:hypothetical protein